MKSIFSIKILGFFILVMITGSFVMNLDVSFADEILLISGEKKQGIVLSQEKGKLVFQVGSDWDTYDKENVSDVFLWTETQNMELRKSWQKSQRFRNILEAFKGGPKEIKNLVVQYHKTFIKKVESTPVFAFVMKWQFLRDFKGNNPHGFKLGIYCVTLFLLAIAIKITIEAFFFILSLFGYRPQNK